MIPADFVDGDGRNRRTLIPEEAGIPPEQGIPLSMELDDLFPNAPRDFMTALHNSLWNNGLIEPKDYLQPGAAETYKRALLAVIRLDFAKIRQFANEHEVRS